MPISSTTSLHVQVCRKSLTKRWSSDVYVASIYEPTYVDRSEVKCYAGMCQPSFPGLRVIRVQQQQPAASQFPSSTSASSFRFLSTLWASRPVTRRCRFRRWLFVNTSRTSMNYAVGGSPLTPQIPSSSASPRRVRYGGHAGLPDRGVRNIHHRQRAVISRRAHHLSAIVVVTKHRDRW